MHWISDKNFEKPILSRSALLCDVECAIKAGFHIFWGVVAILQVKDLGVVCFLGTSGPVDELLGLHAEADVVGRVHLQRLERGSELKRWNAFHVNVLLQIN